MQLTKAFTFDAAHFVPNYYGKCERMHGHTYKLQVTVEGEVGANGMVMDFVVLKKMVKEKVLDKLDHQILNDVIEVATAENVVKWIWEQLVDLKSNVQEQMADPATSEAIAYYHEKEDVQIEMKAFSENIRLFEVKLWETPTSSVTYHGK